MVNELSVFEPLKFDCIEDVQEYLQSHIIFYDGTGRKSEYILTLHKSQTKKKTKLQSSLIHNKVITMLGRIRYTQQYDNKQDKTWKKPKNKQLQSHTMNKYHQNNRLSAWKKLHDKQPQSHTKNKYH